MDLEPVTLYHLAGREGRANVWTRTVMEDTFWDSKAAITVNASEQRGASVFSVRVFLDAPLLAACNDVLARGLRMEDTPQAAREAGATCFTVYSVKDNRRGSPRMRHWRLEGF